MDQNFILINKPADWTSFDVINFLRKKIKNEHPELKKIKVGHAGTLDPFATGLLIAAIGRENTKHLDEFKNLPKTYVATIHLGATSDTYDKTGIITNMTQPCHSRFHGNDNRQEITALSAVARNDIKQAVTSFLGPQFQTPPMFSAKKINGQRLYKLARQGKTIERQPNQIDIYDIKIINYEWPKLILQITCSPGTYIRAIANDLGQKLGTGAYCEELCRTAIGPYTLKNAQNIQ